MVMKNGPKLKKKPKYVPQVTVLLQNLKIHRYKEMKRYVTETIIQIFCRRKDSQFFFS